MEPGQIGLIVLLLGQDGATNGAIYALLALSIVLVFSVTRILLIPQGEFVVFGAMCMAALENGKPVHLAWLLLALSLLRLAIGLPANLRAGRWPGPAAWAWLAYAFVALVAARYLAGHPLSTGSRVALTLLLVVPLGPLLYDSCFRPIATAGPLVLLIVAIAVHEVLVGLSLLMFGADGARASPLSEGGLAVGPVALGAQTLWVGAVSLALILLLWAFFGRSLYGKALRATAIDRFGAQLVGISPTLAGQISFALAALIGALSGILIAPITTLYYDSGLVIGLKGFAGAIAGGLASYPVAAAGALVIGLTESFSTFFASSYKEVIVFTLVLPFLLWLSLKARRRGDGP